MKDDTFLKPALLFGRIGEALISDSTVAFSLRRRQAHVELESADGREEANLDGERKKKHGLDQYHPSVPKKQSVHGFLGF